MIQNSCDLGYVCVQNIVVLKPNNITAIYCYKSNFSDQLAITVHNSSIVREFILPIWSQTFLINSRLNLRFQQPRNNWKCALRNPIRFMRDPSLPFYFQKAPVFEVFHTHSFLPAALWIKRCLYGRCEAVCVLEGRRGRRTQTQREEIILLDFLILDKWVTRQREWN